MDYFGALGAFVHAAETRSFTESGRRLGTSSSAVGKAVVRLEEELGVRLFHRSTRAITLTAEGQLFQARCQKILADFDVARAELVQAKVGPQGKLRVALPQLGSHLMPYLVEFQQRYPQIELELDFSDRLANVIDEGFDAVLRIGMINDSRLTIRQLTGYKHRLVASPDYLSRNGVPLTPDDLKSHACLRYRFPTSGKLDVWPLVENGVILHLELPQSAIANTIDSLFAIAESGIGIALLPDFMVENSISFGSLQAVLNDNVHDHRNVCILWPSSRQQLPKIKAFVDFIVSRLRSGKSCI
ncbi:LysR family transcriptional regulator (plasmid) [Erwinia pyri]|uniref:LysR family transcriptional regulator n=1 Tax=Erwinia pyri TaxID=3062598 RepID=A0AA50HT11_9GAMM|nr:LysR family transcriptional regulator [Erwinia sp. DE2]WLS81203.1 LysR family transcriptional regulator [Erwinia sp. DE2]